MKKILFALLAASMLIGCQEKKDDNVIRIACNLPMTGYIGYYGQWIQNGLELAKKDLQHKLDSIGIAIEIDYQDNKGETKDAINIFQKQMMQAPDLYMSGITTQTMSILDQVESRNIPHMLWSWTPLELTKGLKEYRCWVNYGIEGQHIAEYCIAQSPKRVACLYLNILGAKVQCNDVIVPALQEYNPDIELYIEEYPIETTNFRDIALKVKEFNPDVIVLSGFKDNILNATRDFSAYNIDKNKIICSMDLLDAINEASNEILEGYHVTAPAFNIKDLRNDYTQKWIDSFIAKFGHQPLYTEAYGYDAMMALIEAANIMQRDKCSLDVALSCVNLQGITGPLRFEDNGELEDNLHIGVFHNGILYAE